MRVGAVATVDGATRASAPATEQPTLRQFILSDARQLTLDGREEPLSEPAELGTAQEAPEPRQAQADMFAAPQLPLPLPVIHPLENGKPNACCVRGWQHSACPHHGPRAGDVPEARPETCSVQRCESSYKANTLERARDAWNGTADDPKERIGLRHFGDIPFGVFVFTVPAELRPLCIGARERRFREEAGRMAIEVMQRLAGTEHAEVFARGWMHPVGEPELPDPEKSEYAPAQGDAYVPHENVLVPLVAWHSGTRTAIRLNRRIPRSWMGRDGWVGERWRARLVSVFGQWWRGDAPPVNWFYEYRAQEERKQHALRYFARVFPAWAGHPDVPLRPRAFGLAHWKHRAELAELLDQVHAVPLPAWGTCRPCIEANETPPQRVTGNGRTPEEALFDLRVQLARHFCVDCEGARRPPYAQDRRIMTPSGPGHGTGPPFRGTAGPPEALSTLPDDPATTPEAPAQGSTAGELRGFLTRAEVVNAIWGGR